MPLVGIPPRCMLPVVEADQLDRVLTYVIYAALSGLGIALMMYVVAAVGRRFRETRREAKNSHSR